MIAGGLLFHGTSIVFEGTTDELWLFRPEYVANIFSKVNRVSPSLQGKQLTLFVAKDKI